ncbi:LADA_0G16446g1_1 [Lachancea dasiensis]|uniref:LADA_0G16446g1_1 n=1 Tax=Lachancea dasiensis TaxID=1072105 RepID=A0A1G4JX42_9SACH|nr:LADA_0G16446g1_1 [Lachancea dasiensis]
MIKENHDIGKTIDKEKGYQSEMTDPTPDVSTTNPATPIVSEPENVASKEPSKGGDSPQVVEKDSTTTTILEKTEPKEPSFPPENAEKLKTAESPQLKAEVTVDNDERSSKSRETSERLQSDSDEDAGDDADSIIDIVSESEVNEAAKQLLNAKAPQIKVNYKGDTFLLLGEYDGDNGQEWDKKMLICEDTADLHRGCNVIFGRIRVFLQNLRGGLDLLSRELQMEFPDLDLRMEEDNMYNKDITINDIVSIFKILKDNSIKKCEPNVPTFLTINVSTKGRFVSRYNSLVELLSDNATFSTIRVFSNDQSHPVVLDDTEQPDSNNKEVIIMSSDDEKGDLKQNTKSIEENAAPVENIEKSDAILEEQPSDTLKRKRESISDGSEPSKKDSPDKEVFENEVREKEFPNDELLTDSKA